MKELTSQEAYEKVRESKTPLALIALDPDDMSLWLYTTDGVSTMTVPTTEVELEAIYELLKKRYDIHPESAKRHSGDDMWNETQPADTSVEFTGLDRDERSSVNPNNGRTTTWQPRQHN